MKKEQSVILFVMAALILLATMAFIQNIMTVGHGLSSKVLPRILIDGPAVNFTRNGTDLQVEITQQAIESCDDKDC